MITYCLLCLDGYAPSYLRDLCLDLVYYWPQNSSRSHLPPMKPVFFPLAQNFQAVYHKSVESQSVCLEWLAWKIPTLPLFRRRLTNYSLLSWYSIMRSETECLLETLPISAITTHVAYNLIVKAVV